jgi:hypothetical protein
MTMTLSDLVETIDQNRGEELPTSGRQATFRAERINDVVTFTLSTGSTRDLKRPVMQRYLDVFNEKQSTTISDYPEDLYSRSYVLAIIQLWVGQHHDGSSIDDSAFEDGIDPEVSAAEGIAKLRSHWQRERRPELVRMAKDLFRCKNKRLFCEVCGFDFGKTYGAPNFIEAHHKTPLCDLEPGMKTKLSDLAMVCANCHRMLHRGTPWPTIAELKKMMGAATSSSAKI